MRSFKAHDMQRLNIRVGFSGFVPDESRSHLVENDERLMSAQCIYMSCMYQTNHINSYKCLRSNSLLEVLFGNTSQDKKSRPYSWSRVLLMPINIFYIQPSGENRNIKKKQRKKKKNNETVRQPLAVEFESTILVMIELFT